jgi:hypothetical protein
MEEITFSEFLFLREAKSAGDEPAHEKSAGVHKNGNNATTENQ